MNHSTNHDERENKQACGSHSDLTGIIDCKLVCAHGQSSQSGQLGWCPQAFDHQVGIVARQRLDLVRKYLGEQK